MSETTLAVPLATAGTQFSETVFRFCDDDNITENTSPYAVRITLRDGNTIQVNSSGCSAPPGASAQIVADGDGEFSVQVTYKYAAQIYAYSGKAFQVTVTNNIDSATTSASAADFSVA